jgi:hypothetical protein
MNLHVVPILLFIFCFLPDCLVAQSTRRARKTIRFQTLSEFIPNPERGFAPSFGPPNPRQVSWDRCGTGNNFSNYSYTELTPRMSLDRLQSEFRSGTRVIKIRYHIAQYRNQPLSKDFLSRLDNDFATIRVAGLKVIPRFTYNWPQGGPDTTLARILSHLDQLRAILRRNSDVLFVMELGFIGCWGEQHTSSNNLVDRPRDLNSSSIAIINKALSVLPPNRKIALRYPVFKFQFFSSSFYQPIQPTSYTDVASSNNKSRLITHDDCLVCGEYNAGTFWSPRENPQELRQFLSSDNLYAGQIGEPGDIGRDSEGDYDKDGFTRNYADCARVVPLLKQMRWSVMNSTYTYSPNSAYDIWRSQGCYKTIAERLGYRFELKSVKLPRVFRKRKDNQIELSVVNSGWASLINPRKVKINLINNDTTKVVSFTTNVDPRSWLPGKSSVEAFSIKPKKSLARGRYDVCIGLADESPRLANRSDYSIRFASTTQWDERVGCNVVARSVVLR